MTSNIIKMSSLIKKAQTGTFETPEDLVRWLNETLSQYFDMYSPDVRAYRTFGWTDRDTEVHCDLAFRNPGDTVNKGKAFLLKHKEHDDASRGRIEELKRYCADTLTSKTMLDKSDVAGHKQLDAELAAYTKALDALKNEYETYTPNNLVKKDYSLKYNGHTVKSKLSVNTTLSQDYFHADIRVAISTNNPEAETKRLATEWPSPAEVGTDILNALSAVLDPSNTQIKYENNERVADIKGEASVLDLMDRIIKSSDVNVVDEPENRGTGKSPEHLSLSDTIVSSEPVENQGTNREKNRTITPSMGPLKAKASASLGGSGLIVMLKPPQEAANKIADQLPELDISPDELHITVLYVGKASAYDDSDIKKITEIVEDVSSRYPAFECKLQGIGIFNNREDDGKRAMYASVDAIGLAAFRTELLEAIEDAGISVKQDYDFTPHMTLAYVDSMEDLIDVEEAPEVQWVSDQCYLAVENEQTPIKLTGSEE